MDMEEGDLARNAMPNTFVIYLTWKDRTALSYSYFNVAGNNDGTGGPIG